MGAPVSFVVKDLNLADDSPDVGRVCSVAGCDDDSLVNRVSFPVGRSLQLHIAIPGFQNEVGKQMR